MTDLKSVEEAFLLEHADPNSGDYLSSRLAQIATGEAVWLAQDTQNPDGASTGPSYTFYNDGARVGFFEECSDRPGRFLVYLAEPSRKKPFLYFETEYPLIRAINALEGRISGQVSTRG